MAEGAQLDPDEAQASSNPLEPDPDVEAAPEPAENEPSVPDATPAPPEPPPQMPDAIRYTVQPGDTLLGLALHFQVSMASIQLMNGMGDSIDLTAGQELIVATEPLAFGENTFWIVHVVLGGETLVELGQTYGLSVDDILRVNSVADPALINVGQRLIIPLEGLYVKAPPTPPPAAVAAVPAAAQSPPQAGETLTETNSNDEDGEAPPTPTPIPAPPVPGPPAGEADWPAYILARINQARAENGLPALTIVPELTIAAQAHAEDCAQRGWGSHVGSDGANLRTRLARVGYQGTNVGENWVQALNAVRAFEWWYGEIPPNDPHRRNILSPHYSEIGIGIASTGWGYIFVTDFGRR